MHAGEIIPGKMVFLRAVEEEDLSILLYLLNDGETSLYAGSSRFPVSTNSNWQHHFGSEQGTTSLAIVHRESKETIGVSQISAIDWQARSADSGIKLLELHRGQGLGFDACRARDAFLFYVLGLRRLEWRVFDFNARSQALARALSYTHEGTLREVASRGNRWRNLEIYALLRSEAEKIDDFEWYRRAVCPGLS